jgi:hypothetical protein
VAGNRYAYVIWGHVADGHGLWTSQAVSAYPESSLVDGKPLKAASVPRPQPEHWWSPTRLPRPVLSAPRVQKRVAAGDRFSVSGTLSPQHPAGAHSVVLNAYRWTRRAWVLRRTLLTTDRDAAGATRWVVTLALGRSGRWKLVAAALPDADHSASTSSPAFVTVAR